MRADHAKVKRQLNIVRGQIDGLLTMVDEDAYCIDVSNLIMAAIAGLKKANAEVVTAHLEHCVKQARDEDEADEKIDEVRKLMLRLMD
mgnify:CR=1 FL=1